MKSEHCTCTEPAFTWQSYLPIPLSDKPLGAIFCRSCNKSIHDDLYKLIVSAYEWGVRVGKAAKTSEIRKVLGV